MKTTVNLGLKKPEGTDVVNIDDFNYNADVIDTEMTNLKNGSTKVGASVSADTAAKFQTARSIALNGDVTGTTNFDGSANVSITTTLPASGIVAGTYPKVTVNSKGLVTGGANLAASDIPNLDWSKITSSKPITLAGYGITDAISSSKLGQTGGPAKQDDFVSHLADYVRQSAYAVATNSGNNYSISTNPAPTSYIDGMGAVVKFNAASTGAITLNWNGLGAKNVVDSLGNTVTNVKANYIYSLKYESVSGNFIVQGKGGGGNATADKLLSGYTATADTGQITGAIPITTPSYSDQLESFQTSVGAYSYGVANNYAYLKVPANTYLNNINWIFHYEPDLLASNILSGKSIFGVAGSAIRGISFSVGDNIIISADAQQSCTANGSSSPSSNPFTKCKEIQISFSGTIRVSFDMMANESYGTLQAQIYINDTPRGSLRQYSDRSTWITYTEDFNVNENDKIQLYIKGLYFYGGYIRNFRIKDNVNFGSIILN